MEQIALRLVEPTSEHTGRRVREAARIFVIDISLDRFAIDLRLECQVKPLKFADKLGNRFNDNPEPRQVVQLLQQQNADDNVQVLRWTTHSPIEMGQHLINRKIIKKMLSETPAQERSGNRRRFSPNSVQRSNNPPVRLSRNVILLNCR